MTTESEQEVRDVLAFNEEETAALVYELDKVNWLIDKTITALEDLKEVPLQDLVASVNSIIEMLA